MSKSADNQAPSIEELLKTSDWETRVADARRRRGEVLKERQRVRGVDAAMSPPPEAGTRSADILRLTQRRDGGAPGQTLVPVAPDSVPVAPDSVSVVPDDEPSHGSARQSTGRIAGPAWIAVACVAMGIAFSTGYVVQRDVLPESTPPVSVSERPDTVAVQPADTSEPPPKERTADRGALSFGPDLARTPEPDTRPSLALEEPATTIVISETSPPPPPRPDDAADVAKVAVAPARGALHLSGGGDGKARDALLSAGFDVRPAPDPGLPALEAEVRYFHPADRENAAAAARVVNAALRDYSSFRPAPPTGRIEIVLTDPD